MSCKVHGVAQLISEKNELDFSVTWAATIFVPVGSWKMTFV